MATFEDFEKLDIRIGQIIEVKEFPEAKKPAYKIWADFGEDIGIKQSSAQITDLYSVDKLLGRQILAVVNFPKRKIAGFSSEVLILGTYSKGGVVLIQPDSGLSGLNVKNGDKLG